MLQKIVYQVTCALLVGNMTLMGCSCSKKEVKPISLGTSGTGSSGDGQGTGTGGSGDGNGGNGQGGEGSGSGEGNGASGTGGEERGQEKGSVGKESAETQSGATKTTESAGDAKTNSDGKGKGKGMSSDGEQNSQKSGKSASANRVETPPALPGRPPDEPKFSVAEAIQVADREMASARRSRTAGDLPGAFEFASKAYEAVSPYIESNESCKKKADQANKLLELINKEQPQLEDVTKPSVFE